MRLLKKLERMTDFWFLVFINLLFFFLRLPSLFEPNWYGDEGIYQAIGLALKNGEILYRDIWDNKPPGLYNLYSMLGSDQFLLRLASLIFGIIGIIFFFKLSKKLFPKAISYRSCTALFTVLFGLPLIEGNIANAENFMIPLIITSAYLVYSSIEKNVKNKYRVLALSGFILGISFLFKIVSIFDLGAFLIFLFIYDFPEKINFHNLINQFRLKLKTLLTFTSFFILPFVVSVIYFWTHHILGLYLSSILLSNVGYVGYGNKFIIPQGLLILKIIILIIGVSVIFIKRQYLKFNSILFVLLWLSFSFFNTFFSQRGYPHYVLVLLPSFCLLFGLIFIGGKLSKLTIFIFLASLMIVLNYFSLYGKNIRYYKNFLGFVADHRSVSAYQSFFDRNTPRDYAISTFLNANLGKDDKIFIWGNNAQVYEMTNRIPPGKYTVAYHINQYPDGIQNTKAGIENNNPKFIVVMPNVSRIPFSLYNYHVRMNIAGALIYERNI